MTIYTTHKRCLGSVFIIFAIFIFHLLRIDCQLSKTKSQEYSNIFFQKPLQHNKYRILPECSKYPKTDVYAVISSGRRLAVRVFMQRQHRRSIIQQNMEAFIITDKVIAQEHMLNPATRPKYIKKYDVPSNNLQTRKITHLTHKPHIKIIPLTAPRNKEVLLQLCQPLTKKNSRISTPQLERYFTLVSEGWRQGPRKNKLGLLVKKFEPHSQQYDADFKAVSRRAPSWTLLGKKNQPQTLIRSSQQPDLVKENILGACNQVSRSVQLGQLLEREEQRLQGEGKGMLGQSFEPKLHYSPTDLGRCTTNIFKKYNLDKDPNFKKFLADLQNETS